MNSNLSKTLIYLGIIIVGTIFLFYFFKTFTAEDMNGEIPEVAATAIRTKVEGTLDLKLFEDDKFINLKEIGDRETFFKAGRRNPFEPYE